MKCRSEEGLQLTLKLCFYHLASFLESYGKLPRCYNKVLGCHRVPSPLRVTSSQIIKIQQCQLLLSSRALQQQQQQSCGTQTKPLRVCRQSHATAGQQLNGDPQAGGMQIRHQHVAPFWQASTSTALWPCIWAACDGICIIFFAETGGKKRSWNA